MGRGRGREGKGRKRRRGRETKDLKKKNYQLSPMYTYLSSLSFFSIQVFLKKRPRRRKREKNIIFPIKLNAD